MAQKPAPGKPRPLTAAIIAYMTGPYGRADDAERRAAAGPRGRSGILLADLRDHRPRGQEATVVILEEIGELRVEAVAPIDDRDQRPRIKERASHAGISRGQPGERICGGSARDPAGLPCSRPSRLLRLPRRASCAQGRALRLLS